MKRIIISLMFFLMVFSIVFSVSAKTKNAVKVVKPKNPVSVSINENIVATDKMNENDVPADLKSWTKWATYGYEKDNCISGIGNSGKYCNYLSEVKIDVSGDVFRFSMRVKMLKDGYIQIVGSKNAFPDQITADNTKLPIVAKNNLPFVYLKKGEYFLKGKGKSAGIIRYINIPNDAVIISVSENNTEINAYSINNGVLRLENSKTAKKSDTDTVSLTVFRKIIDGIPLRMIVRLDMNVSGKERTENLGRIIPRNFALKSISSPFPAYMKKDGSLMAEVRAGNYSMEIEFRQLKESLDLNVDLLSEQEIWVFQKAENYRFIEPPISLNAVDTKGTSLPSSWQFLPAYLVEKGNNVLLSVGPEVKEKNDELTLNRKMKLAYSGDFYSVEDKITADFKYDGRLLLGKPFVLSSAKIENNPVPITSVSGEKSVGIEVRSGDKHLNVTSRIDADLKEFPVSGYNKLFEKINWQLVLAPGYSLFHVLGAEKISTSWINSWDLLGVFEVMVLAVIFFYLFGMRVAFLSTCGFFLMHPLFPDFTYTAFILSLLIFISRHISQSSAVAAIIRYIKISMLLIIVAYLLAFFVPHLVNAVYPETFTNMAVRVNYRGVFVFYLFSLAVYLIYRIIKLCEKSAIKKLFYFCIVVFSFFFLIENISVNEEVFSNRMMMAGEEAVFDGMAHKNAGFSSEGIKTLASVGKNIATDGKLVIAKAQNYQSLNITKNLVQTGFGFPSWDESNSIDITFSDAVFEKMTAKIILIPPVVNMVLAFLRFVLIVYILYVFTGRRLYKRISVNKALAMIAFVFAMFPLNNMVNAAEYPSAEMLKELRDRLVYEKPSICLPDSCISYPVAVVSNDNNLLSIRLTAYALEPVVAPLPEVKAEGSGIAKLKRVSVGRKDADLTKYNGKNAILLSKGENIIDMQYVLDDSTERFFLSSLFKINLIEDKMNGFSLYAVQGPQQVYQLNRKSVNNFSVEDRENKINVEPYFRVERTFNIGNIWQVYTSVYKETENQRTTVIEIPLLKGEKVISSEGILLKNRIRLSFGANDRVKTFSSVLPVEEKINMMSAESLEKYREIWRFTISNLWSVRYDGMSPVLKSGNHMTEFNPTAKQTLTVNIFKPDSVPGNVVTFDNVIYDVKVQKDFTDLALHMELRASESGTHSISVPQNVKVKSLYLGGRPYPIVIKDGMLILSVNQGNNNIRVLFRADKLRQDIFSVPVVDLNAPAVDITENVKMPQSRWVVFARGPLKGPAVLFIPYIPVLILISFILGRLKLYPIGSFGWFILLLGLSQAGVISNLVVISWFIVMGLRNKYSLEILSWKKTVQCLLGFMSLLFVLSLLYSIKSGLLGSPEMIIYGNRSSAYNLKWYTDMIDALTPEVMVVTLPMFFYKLVMLLWAAWLAYSFVKWIRWGISVFCKDGVWVRKNAISEEVKSEGKEKKQD